MSKIKTAVFPVAGLGTRFLPATKAIPKEMLVVVDKPLIQYAVEEARAAGIERFVFVTSQGKTAIEDHFDVNKVLEEFLNARSKDHDLEKLQLLQLDPGQAIFIRQQRPLGLGHAVLCAKNLIDEDAFALILADDLILSKKPCLAQMIQNYSEEIDGHMAAVMAVQKSQTNQYGILEVSSSDDLKVKASNVVEKPLPEDAPSNIAIIGRYILNKNIFTALEQQTAGVGGEIQLTDALQKQIGETGLTGFKFDGDRYDCGTKHGWLEANIAFSIEQPELKDHMYEIMERYQLKGISS
jgi:UTP--glucose-1-phosphate uridylyltransferase